MTDPTSLQSLADRAEGAGDVWQAALSAYWRDGGDAGAARAIQQALDAAEARGREKERAGVVAWLRAKFEETGFDFEYAAYVEAADAITSLQHHTEGLAEGSAWE